MEEDAKENEIVHVEDAVPITAAPVVSVEERRDSLDAQEAATANEVRDFLMEVAVNSRTAHDKAMECHNIFVDMMANGDDPEVISRARTDMVKSLETAQLCNDSMLKAVKLMLDSRKKDETTAGLVQKGQIQNNFIFQGDHRKVNEELKKRKVLDENAK